MLRQAQQQLRQAQQQLRQAQQQLRQAQQQLRQAQHNTSTVPEPMYLMKDLYDFGESTEPCSLIFSRIPGLFKPLFYGSRRMNSLV